ncbi:mitochondrial thioredoxin [Tulasnella sp. 419]|nr:mitochondrial thioredoxin [Tulasnella sp. 418]KAG8969763.1 mitochondrial thioredoxin [Tulasnella sp. 419]
MSGDITEVTSYAQYRGIIKRDEYSIFDFYTTWCAPCKVISPVFEKLAKEYPEVKFYKVDGEAVPDVHDEARITSLPTFIIFKNGDPLPPPVYGADAQALERMLANLPTGNV